MFDGKQRLSILELAADCDIDGIPCAGGHHVGFEKGRLSSAILAREHVLMGRRFPRRTSVYFMEGHLRSVMLQEDWEIDGVLVQAGSPLEFYENGQPKLMLLARSCSVLGKAYERGTLLQFDPEGHVSYAQLPRDNPAAMKRAAHLSKVIHKPMPSSIVVMLVAICALALPKWAAAVQATRPDHSTKSAEAAVDGATGAALQADAAAAVKILLDVPDSAYAGEDATFRACMIERFGASAKPTVPAVDDPWTAELARAYVHYWQRSLRDTAERTQAERELRGELVELIGHSLPGDANLDAAEEEIKNQAQKRGFYALLGVTAPLRELMLWRKTTIEQRQVRLPEGSYTVKVTFLDDFVLRGWGYYATCGRRSTGGWATEEGLFAVVPAYKSLNDETFSVRFLAHETQHFADKHSFGNLKSWELEYRAKLTELALAVSSQDSTLQRICENRSQTNESAHAYADFHVIRDMGEHLGSSDSDLCGATGIRGRAIRDAAREILISDSGRRKRRQH